GEDIPVQSTSANNHVVVGSPLTEMLSGNSDSFAYITDPEINFAQNNANNLLHLPAQLDDIDVTQVATFKSSTSVQWTPADDDHHDPEINFASNAKDHLLQQPDDDGTMTDGAHPAHPHSDVTQLAN